MTDRILRIATAVLVAAGGAIHLKEWADFISEVPKIGPLFLVNVAASVVVVVLLFAASGWLGLLGAIGLSLGTLGGYLLARYGTLLQYQETQWRTTAVLAAVTEVAAAAIAAAAAARRLRAGSSSPTQPNRTGR